MPYDYRLDPPDDPYLDLIDATDEDLLSSWHSIDWELPASRATKDAREALRLELEERGLLTNVPMFMR